MTRNVKFIGSAIGNCGRVLGCESTPYYLINALAEEDDFVDCCSYAYKGHKHDQFALRNYFIKVASHISFMLNKNTFPVLLGGDHSCAIGTWSGVGDYILSQGEELSMIWIDAHMDAHRPETSQSGNLHGMPVSHLLGYGHPELTSILTKTPKLKPENLVYFGIRSYEPEEKEFIDKLGIKVYYQDQLNEENFIELFANEFKRLSKQTKHVGISLDLDGLSASEFTAVGTPEEGGVSGETFIKALDQIDFDKLVAFEISEYNPKLDYERKSLAYMIHLIKYLRHRIENGN